MAGQSLGGYFVEIGAKTNKSSFENALKSIDGIGNSITRLVGTVRNAAPLLLAAATGVVETAELKAADAIGISTEALDAWKTSAAIAGTNANALVSDMTALERKMQGLKLGQVDAALAQNLGFLNLGYGEFAGMDATERIAEVFSRAGEMEDQKTAALLVGNILGSAALDYYYYLRLSGKSLQEQLAFADRLVFTTEDSKKNALQFNGSMQALKESSKSIMALLGGEIGGQLLPFMTAITNFIANNHDAIQNGIIGAVDLVGEIGGEFAGGMNIENIASAYEKLTTAAGDLVKAMTGAGTVKDGLKKIAEGLGYFTGTAIEYTIKLVTDLSNTLSDLLKGNWTAAGSDIKSFLYDLWEGMTKMSKGQASEDYLDEQKVIDYVLEQQTKGQSTWEKLKYGVKGMFGLQEKFPKEKLPSDLRAIYDNNPAAFGDYIQDGVVSPDGHVTHVDPNDWVFAVKDLGDLARGFIPAASGGTAIQYTIQQTINMNGSGASAFDVRRQAYEGTSKALLDNIAQSSRRLQLMPATK